jgi:hypothetical protein
MQLSQSRSAAAGASQWRRRGGVATLQHRVCAAAAPQPVDAPASKKQHLVYEAIALDMDGTLTKAHIDFVDMRKRTGGGASSEPGPHSRRGRPLHERCQGRYPLTVAAAHLK